MASPESAPAASSTPETSETPAKTLEQAMREKAILDGEINFGAYDDVTEKAEGEVTYEEYLAARPSGKGEITRQGEEYTGPRGGKRSAAEYHEQLKASGRYADVESVIFAEQDATEAPDYDNMTVREVREAMKIAREYGDVAEIAALERALDPDYVSDAEKAATAEVGPDYKAMGLMEIAKEAAKAKLADNTDKFDEIRAIAKDNLIEQAQRAENGVDLTPEELEKELARFDKLSDMFSGRISKPEGYSKKPEAPLDPKDDDEEPEPQPGDDKGAPKITLLGDLGLDDPRKTGAEGTGTDPETKTNKEKAQALWEKAKSGLKSGFTKDFWASKWAWAGMKAGEAAALVGRAQSAMINYRTEGMNEEEAEVQRKKNRRNSMIGVAALALGVGALSMGLGMNALHETGVEAAGPDIIPDTGLTDQLRVNQDLPLNTPELPTSATPDSNLADLFRVDQTPQVNTPELVTPVVDTNPVIDIQRGEGGYALFDRLGLTADQWRDNRDQLLTFTDDFNVVDGGVRIKHAGPLTPGAQAFINGLKG